MKTVFRGIIFTSILLLSACGTVADDAEPAVVEETKTEPEDADQVVEEQSNVESGIEEPAVEEPEETAPSEDQQSDQEIADEQYKGTVSLESALEKRGLDLRSIEAVGDFYYNEAQIVVMLIEPETPEEQEKVGEIKAAVAEVQAVREDKVALGTALYSYDELVTEHNQFFSKTSHIPFSKATIIFTNPKKGNLILETDQLADEYVKEINEIYGDMVEVQINPDFEGIPAS